MLGSTSAFSPSTGTQDNGRGPRMQQALRDRSHQAKHILNEHCRKSSDVDFQDIALWQSDHSDDKYDVQERTHEIATSRSDHPTAECLSSSTTEPIAVPRRRNARGAASISTAYGNHYASPHCNEANGRSSQSEPWQYQHPSDYSSFSSNVPSWQQGSPRSWGLWNQLSESNTSCGTSNESLWCTSPEDVLNHSNHTSGWDGTFKPAAGLTPMISPPKVSIPGSSKHYQPSLASSFPITAGHVPSHMLASESQEGCSSHSRTPTVSFIDEGDISVSSRVSMRRTSSKTKPTRRSRSRSLRATSGTKQTSTVPTPLKRGRRNGQMPPEKALAAREKRAEGSACIRCKMMKRGVSKPTICITRFLLS